MRRPADAGGERGRRTRQGIILEQRADWTGLLSHSRTLCYTTWTLSFLLVFLGLIFFFFFFFF